LTQCGNRTTNEGLTLRNLTLLISIALFNLSALASIDFTQFDLKPIQFELLERMQNRGKYTEENLLKMARSFEKANQNENRRSEYIPPHDQQMLEDINQWAKGGAFSAFASNAGVEFLATPYKEDCPSWAVFNFGRATGSEFLKYDILRGAINISTELQYHYANDRENFRANYLKVAEREQFLKYLSL